MKSKIAISIILLLIITVGISIFSVHPQRVLLVR